MTERRRLLTDQLSTRNVLTVRELLTPEDEELKLELQDYAGQLDEMAIAFQRAISDLDSSTANFDREVRSFTILDNFFNDPEGMKRIDAYLENLYDVIRDEQLNSVTSSIALSALGILETLREIRLENPGFNLGLNQIQTYLGDIQIEKAGLQSQVLALEAETETSGSVLELSGAVETQHGVLESKLDKLRKTEILRNGHVTRSLDNCLSLGLIDTIGVTHFKERERAVRNLMDFALECLQEKSP